MKKLITILSIAAALSLVFCEDDPKDETVCDEAAVIMDTAMTEVCATHTDCAPCDCFAAGQTYDGTECVDIPSGCAGENLGAARVCLADETACASAIVESVVSVCDATE